MALLFFTPFTAPSSLPPPPPPSPPSSHPLFLPITSAPISRQQIRTNAVHTKCFNGLSICTSSAVNRRDGIIVKASSEVDVAGPVEDEPKPESSDSKEKLTIEKLPLESKQQLLLEQRLKMKLAKKIRLRRKRLVRKRHLRKKGRWPPSKMKKLKNV